MPLVVRMKGTNEELGRKILAESGLPIITREQHGRGGGEGRRGRARADRHHEHPHRQGNTKVITQGITGKTGQFHTRMCRDYANGRNCFVAGVNPKKAGRGLRGHPDLRDGARGEGGDRRDGVA